MLADSFLMRDKMTEALKRYFGHGEFRRPQDEIIASILEGKDTLAIMPTGGGKSLCYQLPAMLKDGVTLVISPLIALMKDQVDALVARGIPAAMINSSQTWDEQCAVLKSLENGELKLAYVAPERFRAASFMRALSGMKIGLFAVDEAHCISQWGHDFRPDYMRMGEVLDKLGRPPCAAFTATATPEVKADIVAQLKMAAPSIFVSGFARPNLSFNVRKIDKKIDKEMRVRDLIDRHKTGIVYCATRKSAEALSEKLWEDGVRHVLYHGGMTPSERDSAQDVFVSGKEDVAIATNAFGMGIDRSDIRFVCHYELTGSVEAFYQEAGRAGRDGGPAYCEMLLMYADKRVQEFFIEGANPDENYIRNVYRVLRENSDNSHECLMPVDKIAEEVADIAKFEAKVRASYFRGKRKFFGGGNAANSMAASSALSILRKHGYIDRFDVPGSRTRGTRLLDPDLHESSVVFPSGTLEEKKRRDETKLQDVIRFAYSKECRQEWILRYFGEKETCACGNCDNCRGGEAVHKRALDASELLNVKKALSGVARMSQRSAPRVWTPRFGRDRIIKCLCGSKDERVLSLGLDKLTTYGILKEHGPKFVGALFDALIECGLLEISDGEYPLCALTESGAAVMLGETEDVFINYPGELSRVSPVKKTARAAKADTLFDGADDNPDYDGELFLKLVAMRNKLKYSMGNIPAFRIFPNQVLKSLATLKPGTAEEAMKIKGIGEAKAKKILPPFLEIIRAHSLQ